MTPPGAISLRELAFVRDVLIPRAWVQGAEVDELLHLRGRIDGIFAAAQRPAPEETPRPDQADTGDAPPAKKPRHPKKRRGQGPRPGV